MIDSFGLNDKNETEAALLAIYEYTRDGILVVSGQTNRFIMANPAICRMLGYSESELLNLTPQHLHPPEALPRVGESFERMQKGLFRVDEEVPVCRKDGSIFYADISPTLIGIHGMPCFLGIFRDVTERRQSREALERNEASLAEAQAQLGNWNVDLVTGRAIWSDEYFRLLGYMPNQVSPSLGTFLDAVHPDDRDRVMAAIQDGPANASTRRYQFEHRLTKGEHILERRGQVEYDPAGHAVRLNGTAMDITERKRNDELLARHNRLLHGISAINASLLRQTDEAQLMGEVCRVLVEESGFLMAWIGRVAEDGVRVIPIAETGFEDGYLANADIRCDDSPKGQGPTGTAIRTDTTVVSADIETDPRLAPWRERALSRGYLSSAATPIRLSDRVVGALTTYSAIPNGIGEFETMLLERLASDLGHAMQRFAAEQSLRNSETRIRLLLDSAAEGLYGIGMDGMCMFANPACLRMLGYRHEKDLIGKDMHAAVHHSHPDGSLYPRERCRILAAMALGRSSHGDDEVHWRADGSSFPIEYWSRPIEQDGRRLGAVVAFVDITERKAGELRLRQDREQQKALREMLEDALRGGDMEQVLSACLERLLAVSWLSLLPRGGIFLTEPDAKTLRLAVSHDLAPEVRSACARVPLGRCHCGRAAAECQLQFSHCLDARHEITYPGMTEHGHYSLPLISDGNALGVLVLFLPHGFERDPLQEEFLLSVAGIMAGFIRRKQTGESLRRLNEELEDRVESRTTELIAARDEAQRANEAKSEFLSRMSHELRTPLNAILGFGQLLELDATGPRQTENVREILHAGHHLLELINDVLDLARVEAGRLNISREPVPLIALIEECVTMTRPLARPRGICFLELGEDCGEHVLADRVRLKQVLLNLLSNAVKYNRDQGEVSIACLHDGDNIEIRISDTGPGLSPEQQTCLFTAFERLDADKTSIEGTGIGLALSRRLTELMQGEIGVTSKPGQGSTFWVRLPAVEVHREDTPSDGADPEWQAPSPSLLSRREVLCIEDNPANLRLMERIFSRRRDLHLLSASSPNLGLELAVARRPALVLLDINLPDMDGYEVMKCLRESAATRHIPVVAISANAMPKDLARGKAAGFVEYFTKPLEVDRLLQAIDRILGPEQR